MGISRLTTTPYISVNSKDTSMARVQRGIVKDVILGRCPRCGVGKLFDGWLAVSAHCTHCQLDYAVFDPGDGPAVFVILFEGALAMGGVLWVEFKFSPPLWVQGLIWVPLIGILTLGLLRLIKSLLLVLQYINRSGAGSIY
jgi:uncharacterized protein (DUF983 family)